MSVVILGTALLTGLLLLLTLAVLGARAVLTPMRPATVTVNGAHEVQARTGEKLLGALNDAGILVPSACAGAGTCGLCRVTVTEGETEALPTERARLSRAELRSGVHLACQVVIRDDMGVAVDEALVGATTFEASVESARFLTPLIREIVLKVPDCQSLDLVAGAFVQVTAPAFALALADIAVPEPYAAAWAALRQLRAGAEAPVTRAYSVADRPEDIAAGRIVLNIRLALPPPGATAAPAGTVSSWLFSVQVGDQVTTAGPFGSFHVQPTEREMVFIGGGVGMAPLRAMIHEQLTRVGTSRRMSFWYGARGGAELYYADEFDALAAAHDNFDWTVVLSDPAPGDGWTGATGFVHAVVWERFLRDHPAPEACEFYLCGPPLMIRAVLTMLDDAGVERSSIFNDDFGV